MVEGATIDDGDGDEVATAATDVMAADVDKAADDDAATGATAELDTAAAVLDATAADDTALLASPALAVPSPSDV